MSGLVFQTHALEVKNMGGGFPTKTFIREVEVESGDALVPKTEKKKVRQRMISTKRVPGSDYVIFNCPVPKCGKRNKKSVYEAKGRTQDGRLVFKCHSCRNEIEVQRPFSHIPDEKKTSVVIPNSQGMMPGTILGADGKPLRR